MWTEEDLEKAAKEHMYKVYEKNDDMCDEVSYEDVRLAFLAGCEYIINNTQKTNESKIQETE